VTDPQQSISLYLPRETLARLEQDIRGANRSDNLRLALDRYFALIDAATPKLIDKERLNALRKACAVIEPHETKTILYGLPAIVREYAGADLAAEVEKLSPAERLALYSLATR
jgi:hypothetical protein